jgi:hypothetical protein
MNFGSQVTGFFLGFSLASTAGYVYLLQDYKEYTDVVIKQMERNTKTTLQVFATNKYEKAIAKIEILEQRLQALDIVTTPVMKELKTELIGMIVFLSDSG